MPYATPENVRDAYEGDLPSSRDAWASGLIARAERQLTRLVGDLSAFDPDLVRDTVVDAVLRVARNPQGYKGEHAGDYGYYYGSSSVEGIGFTQAELALFGRGGRQVGSIRVGVPGVTSCW